MHRSHLFRNQKVSVQSIIDKFHGENFVHPECPVPIILQGPTGCGKSLTTCQVAAELDVHTLVVIGPCVARQAWEQAFEMTSCVFPNIQTKMLFVSTSMIVKRYSDENTRRIVYNEDLRNRPDIAARMINTITKRGRYIYPTKNEQHQSQYVYVNTSNIDNLSTDDLFMGFPWHDKTYISNDCNKQLDKSSGRWMLALDESHVTCGKGAWNVQNSILSTICSALRDQKGYLLLISATPISTVEERTGHLKFLGYAHKYNEKHRVYQNVNVTLREIIFPKLSDQDRTIIKETDATIEDVCWNKVLSDHHCVVQKDAPKMTLLEIEARFYEVNEQLFRELQNCTKQMRAIISKRTFTDRYGEEKVQLDQKGYKHISQLIQDLEVLKIPLIAQIIIKTIESEYTDPNYNEQFAYLPDYLSTIDADDCKEKFEPSETSPVQICPKAIVYVNSPKNAEAIYNIVNQHFTEKFHKASLAQKESRKRKRSDVSDDPPESKYPISKIKGILGKSSIPDKRRVKLIDDFNNQADIRYFIATYATFAPSINLQDKTGRHPRYSFLAPTTRFTNLDQAAGRSWRPKACSDSFVRMVFVEGLEEELALFDSLCRRKAIQDKHDLGKLQRPPLPGEYTMKLDRTGEEIDFTASKFHTNDTTAEMRRNEHIRRKKRIALMRTLWTLYYDDSSETEMTDPGLIHQDPKFLFQILSEEMMELVMSYVIK